VLRAIAEEHPSHLLVLDPDGVTGHPDHRHATQAALTAARHQPAGTCLGLPLSIAQRLNADLDTVFTGRDPAELDLTLTVSRQRQWRATARHRSQSTEPRTAPATGVAARQ